MKIIIDLGLMPEGSIHIWDRAKAMVTDDDGNKIGFIDENNGDGRVVIFVYDDIGGVVLGRCAHGIDLDQEFCPQGCRV